MNFLAHLPGRVLASIALQPSHRALPDQFPLEFRSSHQDVEQEPCSRIRFIRINVLAGCLSPPKSAFPTRVFWNVRVFPGALGREGA